MFLYKELRKFKITLKRGRKFSRARSRIFHDLDVLLVDQDFEIQFQTVGYR